jgi:hypothetical protein
MEDRRGSAAVRRRDAGRQHRLRVWVGDCNDGRDVTRRGGRIRRRGAGLEGGAELADLRLLARAPRIVGMLVRQARGLDRDQQQRDDDCKGAPHGIIILQPAAGREGWPLIQVNSQARRLV